MRGNTERRNVRIGWGMALAGLACLGAMPVLGLDGMDGGFALFMLGLLLFPTGLLTAWMFLSRARVMDALLSGEGLLLGWAYPAEEWQAFMGEDAEETAGAMLGLLVLVAVIGLPISLAFVVADPEAGPWVLAVMLVVLGLCAVAAWWTWRGKRREAALPGGEARLCQQGVLLGESLHAWNTVGCRLERAEAGEGRVMIVYSSPARHGTVEVEVAFPIPEGQEEAARDAVARLLEFRDRS